MARPRYDDKRERGAALVIVLVLVVVAGSVSQLVLQRTRLLTSDTRAERAQVQSFYAAEGALEHARVALRDDAGYAGGELEIGGCRVELAVQREDKGERAWVVTLTARHGAGAVPTWRSRIEARLLAGEGKRLPRVVGWRELR